MIFRFLPFPSSAPPTRTSLATLPQHGPPRQLSFNSDLFGSCPCQSQKSALQDFPPKILTVACLASRSSFFLHRSKFKSQNHKMVVFIKLVFRRRHPASCSRGHNQASCSATLWPVTYVTPPFLKKLSPSALLILWSVIDLKISAGSFQLIPISVLNNAYPAAFFKVKIPNPISMRNK